VRASASFPRSAWERPVPTLWVDWRGQGRRASATGIPTRSVGTRDFAVGGPPGACCKSNRQRDLQTTTPSPEGIFSTPSLPWKKLRFTSQVLLSQQFTLWHGRPILGAARAGTCPTSDRKFKLCKVLCCSWHRLPFCVRFLSRVILRPRSLRAVAKGKTKGPPPGSHLPEGGPFSIPAAAQQALPVPGRQVSVFMLTDGQPNASPKNGPSRWRWTAGCAQFRRPDSRHIAWYCQAIGPTRHLVVL